MLKKILILISGLLPLTALASTTSSLFTPHIGDKSVILLQQLFGNVGTSLRAPGVSHLLGALFTVFNMGIWVMGGVFVMYMTLMSVVNTAKDGQFMGKGQMSAWVVVRTVGGITALLPKFSGYSFIQVIVMWVVVQGIGLADHTWSVGLRYFQEGGSVYSQMAGGNSTQIEQEKKELKTVIQDAGNLLNSLICQYAITRSQRLKKQALNPNSNIDTSGKIAPFINEEKHQLTFPIQGDPKKNYCGIYGWSKNAYRGQKEAAAIQLAMDLTPIAYRIMQDPPTDCLNKTPEDIQSGDYCAHANGLLTSAMGYLNVVHAERVRIANNTRAQQQAEIDKAFEKAHQEGWLMAGKYYFTLTNPENAGQNLDPNFTLKSKPLSKAQYTALMRGPSEEQLTQIAAKEFKNALKSSCGVRNDEALCGKNAAAKTYHRQANLLVDNLYQESNNLIGLDPTTKTVLRLKILMAQGNILKNSAGSPANLMKKVIRDFMQGALQSWADIVLIPSGSASAKAYQDPIRRFRALGEKLMTLVINFWSSAAKTALGILAGTSAGFFAALMGIAAAVGATPWGPAVTSASSSGMSMAFQVIMASIFWYLPVGIAISTPLFMVGITLGVYVPLIPFIVFLFGGLGWLIAVVESMVAAPLIALGLTHPEGHDLLGKAEQSLILLLSIFLRPVAMILGFFIGIVLIFAIMQVLDSGFFALFLEQLGTKTMQDPTAIAILAGMMVIYTFTVVAVVNQSFSLIYLLPDRLVRWIGGSPEQSSVPGMMQEVRQSSEQKMGEGARGGADMAQAQRQTQVSPGGVQPVSRDKGAGTRSQQ